MSAADAPRNYEDLADAKWKGKLLIRASGHIYNQSLVGSLLAANGPEKTEVWAKAVAANLARPPRGGDTDQIKGVAAGEAEIAVSNTYYYVNLMGADLAGAFATARDVFHEVDEALKQNLSKLMREGPESDLVLTENAQPALMAVSIAVVRVLEKDGGRPLASLASHVAACPS